MSPSMGHKPAAELPNVFINCRYSEDFFERYCYILFAIACCGMFPVIAKDRQHEINRLEVILDMISKSGYSVHDLSDCAGHLNMPLELGLAVMKDWRDGKFRLPTWAVLVTDREKFSQELSDLDVRHALVYDELKPESILGPLLEWFMQCRGIPDEVTPQRVSDLYPELREGIRKLREAWPAGTEPNSKITDIATEVASRIHGKATLRRRKRADSRFRGDPFP